MPSTNDDLASRIAEPPPPPFVRARVAAVIRRLWVPGARAWPEKMSTAPKKKSNYKEKMARRKWVPPTCLHVTFVSDLSCAVVTTSMLARTYRRGILCVFGICDELISYNLVGLLQHTDITALMGFGESGINLLIMFYVFSLYQCIMSWCCSRTTIKWQERFPQISRIHTLPHTFGDCVYQFLESVIM